MDNKFESFLKQISERNIFVLDTKLKHSDYTPIDISPRNKDLQKFDISSAAQWQKYIEDYLLQENAKVAFGGYLELRNLYDRSDYFANQSENEKRNIHLGIDLWTKENTKVLAALDGEIHSFKNNTNYGDYGPTIIIKHQFVTINFYTLYGHLSASSIENLKVGAKVKKGECIGFLGSSEINGNYAPHLHFQIIKDLENYFGDYPGVSSKINIDFYKINCPNPNLLLQLKMPDKT